MQQLLFFVFIFFFVNTTSAQFVDNFSDGNLSTNPAWLGEPDEFIVNTDFQLQLMAPAAGTSVLYSTANIPDSTLWQFYIKMDFAPSSGNLMRFYLQNNDPTLLDGQGYYIEIGEDGSNDAIKLYRQDNAATRSLLLTGTLASVAAQPAIARLNITRTSNGEWTLAADYTGGSNFIPQGTTTDNTYNGSTNQYVGVYCIYTSTRKDKFFFDDINIQPLLPDTTPPDIASVTLVSSNQLDVYFNEPITSASANVASNYSINNSIGSATSAVIDGNNATLVHLNFGNNFQNTQNYTLTANNIKDIANNESDGLTFGFNYLVNEVAVGFDVLINEIMADPSPVVGLPNLEFLELYNRSNKVISLSNWILNVGSSNQTLGDFLLLPNSYVILCDDANVAAFSSFGNVIPVTTFPSLTNGGATINILNDNDILIHSITYDLNWYGDAVKEDGGWTLELKNPSTVCVAPSNNWTASNAVAGGTPGIQNSVFESTPDNIVLGIDSVNIIANNQIKVFFNKIIDITAAENVANYSIDNAIGSPLDATALLPDLQSVLLTLTNELSGDVVFRLDVNNIADCQGNSPVNNPFISFQLPKPVLLSSNSVSSTEVKITFSLPVTLSSATNINNYVGNNGLGNPSGATLLPGDTCVLLVFSTSFTNGTTYELAVNNIKSEFLTTLNNGVTSFFYYIPSEVSPYDVVINEIYADPSPSLGLPNSEYIELYNRSTKIINLQDFYLNSGASTNYSLPNSLLLPGQYVTLFEENPAIDISLYTNPLAISDMPSLSNEGANLLLFAPNSTVIDAVSYSIAWYGSTSKSDGGWSLERINPNRPCENNGNWSASENPIGGTPGKQNSIFIESTSSVVPNLISAFPIAYDTIRLIFDQGLNRIQSTSTSNYTFAEGNTIVSVTNPPTFYNTVYLALAEPLDENTIYQLTIQNTLQNCINNITFIEKTIPIAIPKAMVKKDLVINEILFNPQVGGVDFIELYNRSNKVVNVGDLNIANNFEGNFSALSIENDFLLFPNEYVVITPEPLDILDRYYVENPNSLLKNDLPTFADDAGNVSIYTFDTDGEPLYVDEFDYNKTYHNALIDNEDGVSLERINPNGFTNEKGNWHSGAQSAGFATPTYRNSQFLTIQDSLNTEDFQLFSPTFSPDGDEYEDFMLINYQLEEVGYLATVKIFDSNGRLIRLLTQNELLSTTGSLKWDGENDAGLKSRMGIYVIHIQYFNPNGNVKEWQKNCVLANNLK